MKFKFENLIIWQNAMKLGYAIRSITEVVTCLQKARRRTYIAIGVFERLYENCLDLMNMVIAFRNKVID